MKSYSTEKQDRLLKIMQEAKGNSLDIYYVIYEEFLHNNETPSVLLPLIFEFSGAIGTNDGASEKVSQQVEQGIIQQYKDYLIKTVNLLAKFNDSKDTFYEKLWSTVFCSPTSPQKTDERAVILKMLNEDVPTLPYYQAIDLLQMENDDFSHRVTQLQPRIKEAIHMLNRHFTQRTEETSQICRLSENLSKEDNYVYWATLIEIIQKNAFRAGYIRGRSENQGATADEEREN